MIVATEDTRIYDKGEFYEGEDGSDKGKFADSERNVTSGDSMIQDINNEIRTEVRVEMQVQSEVIKPSENNNPEITMEGGDD